MGGETPQADAANRAPPRSPDTPPLQHTCPHPSYPRPFVANCLATVRIYRLTIEIIANMLDLASNPNNLVDHATHHHPTLQV